MAVNRFLNYLYAVLILLLRDVTKSYQVCRKNRQPFPSICPMEPLWERLVEHERESITLTLTTLDSFQKNIAQFNFAYIFVIADSIYSY